MPDIKIHEKPHLQQYLRNGAIYFFGGLITKGHAFIAITLIAYIFSQQDVGKITLILSTGNLIGMVLSLYLTSAIEKYYYKIRDKGEAVRQVFVSTHFYTLCTWGLCSVIISISILNSVKIGIPEEMILPVCVFIFSQFLIQINNIQITLWSVELESTSVVKFNLIYPIVNICGLILFLVVFEKNWNFVFYSSLIAVAFQTFILIYLFKKKNWLKMKICTTYIKRSLKFSLPLLPNLAAGWICMFSDRLILTYYGQLENVAVYSVAAQLTLIIYIFNDAITKVNGPLTLSGLSSNEQKAASEIQNFIEIYLVCIVFGYCLLLLFLPFIIDLCFSENYAEAINIICILGWVFITSGIYRVFTVILSHYEMTWVISSGAIIQALVNILLNFVFIPFYGIYAAAISTLLSVVVYTVWLYFWSRKFIDTKVPLKIFTYSLSMGLLFLMSTILITHNTKNISVEFGLTFIVLVLALSYQFLYVRNKLKKTIY